LLTSQAKKKRIEYCLEHMDDRFSNVLFTDETAIQLFENRKWFGVVKLSLGLL